jgi:hypothetical protein
MVGTMISLLNTTAQGRSVDDTAQRREARAAMNAWDDTIRPLTSSHLKPSFFLRATSYM